MATSINVPLQARAGRNIGNELGPVPFVQNAAAPEVDVNPTLGVYTVVLECPPDTARTIQVSRAWFWAVNRGAVSVLLQVFFKDALGNLALLSSGTPVASGTAVPVPYNVDLVLDGAVVLSPGEQIVLRSSAPK